MVDEVEKALAGVAGERLRRHGRLGAGCSARFLAGSRTTRATRSSSAPPTTSPSCRPSFRRAERLDAIFFLDLPGARGAGAIWRMYLRAVRPRSRAAPAPRPRLDGRRDQVVLPAGGPARDPAGGGGAEHRAGGGDGRRVDRAAAARGRRSVPVGRSPRTLHPRQRGPRQARPQRPPRPVVQLSHRLGPAPRPTGPRSPVSSLVPQPRRRAGRSVALAFFPGGLMTTLLDHLETRPTSDQPRPRPPSGFARPWPPSGSPFAGWAPRRPSRPSRGRRPPRRSTPRASV